MDWQELVTKAETVLTERKLDGEYRKRLDDELYEIVKQGANGYWLEQHEAKKTWDKNPNGLVLPWLLGMTPVDPVSGPTKLMIESKEGIATNAIVIQLSNGKEICISEYTMVLTTKGYMRASKLTIDYTIPD